MSHTSPPLRRLLALLVMAAVMTVPLVQVGAASGDPNPDPAVEEAKAAIVAAKAAVELAKSAKDVARDDRDTVRDRLARHTATLIGRGDSLADAERALTKSRNRVGRCPASPAAGTVTRANATPRVSTSARPGRVRASGASR